MQRRLGRPSSSPPPPPEPTSPTHARVHRALDAIGAAVVGRADEFPGGEAMAKLVLSKARKMMDGMEERRLRDYVGFGRRLFQAVETGEGFDELMDGGGGADSPA